MGRMERKLMVVLYFILTPISWGRVRLGPLMDLLNQPRMMDEYEAFGGM
jgi:hypothetical protein